MIEATAITIYCRSCLKLIVIDEQSSLADQGWRVIDGHLICPVCMKQREKSAQPQGAAVEP